MTGARSHIMAAVKKTFRQNKPDNSKAFFRYGIVLKCVKSSGGPGDIYLVFSEKVGPSFREKS